MPSRICVNACVENNYAGKNDDADEFKSRDEAIEVTLVLSCSISN